MLRIMISIVLLHAGAALAACPSLPLPDEDQPAAAPSPSPALAAALTGDWKGSLQDRDFGNDKQVTLPTLASFDGEGTGRFTYDDGPGKTVRSTEQWQLSADGKTFNMGKAAQPMRVSAFRAGPQADFTLVAVGTGEENGAPVLVREMLARRGGCLLISRQTQGLGQPLRTRHTYSLERQQP